VLALPYIEPFCIDGSLNLSLVFYIEPLKLSYPGETLTVFWNRALECVFLKEDLVSVHHI